MATHTENFEQLRELMLLQDFKNCLPENVVVHLNEQKVTSLSNAAVLADEFVLTHRFSSASSVRHDRTRPSTTESSVKNTATRVFSQSNWWKSWS